MALTSLHTYFSSANEFLKKDQVDNAIAALKEHSIHSSETNHPSINDLEYHILSAAILRKQKKVKAMSEHMLFIENILTDNVDIDTIPYSNQHESNKGFIALDTADYHSCIHSLSHSNELSSEDDSLLIAENLIGIGQAQALLSEYDQSIDSYLQSIDLYSRLQSKSGLANAYHYLGVVYSNVLQYVEAHEALQESLKIFREINNEKGVLSCLGNIGVVYITVGDIPKAIDYFQQALSLSESIGDINGAGISIINISNLFYDLENHNQALEYRIKALEVFKESPNKLIVAACYLNLGSSYLHFKDYEKALDCFQQGRILYEEINVKKGLCSALINIADTYINMGEYENAGIQLNYAVQLAEEIDNYDDLSNAFIKYSQVLSHSTYMHFDLERAQDFVSKAISIAEKHELKIRHYNAIHQLAIICEKQEQWKEANTNNKLYFAMKEEIQSREADDKVKALDYRRKMEASERAKAIEMARLQEKELLLHDILPSFIAERIVSGEKSIAETKENVCVLFCDIVGFTRISNEVAPEIIVEVLNNFYSSLDNLANTYGIEKIKTIGDAYMAACGLTKNYTNPRERTIEFSIEILKISKKYSFPNDIPLQLRIGIHIGTIVAGVIGTQKFSYDVWGDTVNVAARMESSGEPGKIHVTDEMIDQLQLESSLCTIQTRGEVSIKGKGIINTHFIIPA